MWDLFIFFIIGSVVGFFVYYLMEDRKHSEKYRDETGGFNIL